MLEKNIEAVLEEYREILKTKAKLITVFGLESDDLIQEGMIGLVKAYNSFDESKGASFKTYANVCIDNAMLNAIAASNRKKNLVLNNAISLDDKDDEGGIENRLAGSSGDNPEEILLYSELLSSLNNPSEKDFSKLEIKVLKLLILGKNKWEIEKELDINGKKLSNTIQRIKTKVKNMLKKGTL